MESRTIREHDRVVFTEDVPEHRLAAGDVGTVAHVNDHGAAYEVEVLTLDATTLNVVTVAAGRVRPVAHRDVLHVRELTA